LSLGEDLVTMSLAIFNSGAEEQCLDWL